MLKPNMVISGKKAAHRAGPEVVAETTLRTLTRHVPPAVPGIAFLSGGQSPQEATLHLALMNKLGPRPGRSPSATVGLCRTPRSRPGAVRRPTSPPDSAYSPAREAQRSGATGRYTAEMESRAA